MKHIILLLILFFVFVKYGEPKPMLMSVHGDVNLVMLETSVTTNDTIAFLYDDQFGGFAINPSICPLKELHYTSFVSSEDCSVQPRIDFNERPSDLDYLVEHDFNSPSTGTETNFIIGYRGSPGFATKSFSNNGEAFEFTDIRNGFSRESSEIYCNDKNSKHYKNLLGPGYNGHAVILFLKDNISKYEQTMKCIALLEFPKYGYFASRLFTVIISDLEPQPFEFQAIGLNEQGVLQDVPVIEPSFISDSNAKESIMETNFVFEINVYGECQTTITMQPTSDKIPAIAFSYNLREHKMPPIAVDDLHHCGIAVTQTTTGSQLIFRYWCECAVQLW